ncbi:hypothetical protein TI39_contig456g00011 [Zymoseptoria brevis]|uniref:Uncharacterized protein n=1 Tax=Zymoseptoria brevis TaxID=1047168 RepID=A0A0F4GKC9_9PEZI|nr:hypothetical protein TI39_contig456g00011 [Zymoseptoria brevis]
MDAKLQEKEDDLEREKISLGKREERLLKREDMLMKREEQLKTREERLERMGTEDSLRTSLDMLVDLVLGSGASAPVSGWKAWIGWNNAEEFAQHLHGPRSLTDAGHEPLNGEADGQETKATDAPSPSVGRTSHQNLIELSSSSPESAKPSRATANRAISDSEVSLTLQEARNKAGTKGVSKAATIAEVIEKLLVVDLDGSVVTVKVLSIDMQTTLRAKIEAHTGKVGMDSWKQGCLVSKANKQLPKVNRCDGSKKDGEYACSDCVQRKLPCIWQTKEALTLLPLAEKDRMEGAAVGDAGRYWRSD